MKIKAEISIAEFLDKLCILEIKSERINDENKLKNVRRELAILRAAWESSENKAVNIDPELSRLKKINETLWELEDKLRLKESQNAFDDEFIELARSVYQTNDRRAETKRQINIKVGSELIEEKSYPACKQKE